MVAQATLICHRGAREVTREQLSHIQCPEAQGRWKPVPHGDVLAHAESALTDAGYGIDKVSLALSRNDARFFGTLTLRTPLSDGVNLAVGLRSSFDKSISLQWCCGSRVFVCDNLAFSSQTMIARKHTTFGIERYHEAISRVVSELGDYREYEAFRIREMQQREVSDEQAESILLRAFECGIIGPAALPLAIQQWRNPSFAMFAQAKTAWRLYNALTFALGKRARSNPQAHARATIRLGAMVMPSLALPASAQHGGLREIETDLQAAV
jgi:hypothetical protein